MKLSELKSRVESHTGVFLCTQLATEEREKTIPFFHSYENPKEDVSELEIPGFREFYETFERLVLYQVPNIKEAAFYIASPRDWARLDKEFRIWISDLSAEEERDLLPHWIHHSTAIGEIPRSGNYLITPLTGQKSGHIFEFEHDGFEFVELASGLEQFVRVALRPDQSALRAMASHMRFVEEGDYSTQWWIEEMRDSDGRIVSTRI